MWPAQRRKTQRVLGARRGQSPQTQFSPSAGRAWCLRRAERGERADRAFLKRANKHAIDSEGQETLLIM